MAPQLGKPKMPASGFTRTPFHVNRLGTAKVDELVPPCVLQRWADPKELAYPMLEVRGDVIGTAD